MTEKSAQPEKRDFSCEILSFIVIAILSELSHFWFILIAIGIAILFWVIMVVLAKLMLFAAKAFSWGTRAELSNDIKPGDIGNQVFPPAKIRQSVDC
jgi:hypothetical protein